MDAKAKRILFRTHWSNGWIDRPLRSTPPEDFAYARAQGVMFDPVTWTHDGNVACVQQFRAPDVAQAAGAGFAASLSSRRVEWRSALASWAMVEHLPPHAYVPDRSGESYDSHGNLIRTRSICRACRDTPPNWQLTAQEAEADIDLNVLSFQRLKWGGVRHHHLDYARFDLEQFARGPRPEPTAADWDLLRALLATISAMPASAAAGRLARELKPVIPGTIAEDRRLVEILGVAGVLRPAARDRSEHLHSDWGPAGQWRGSDGYDRQRVRQLFGETSTLAGITPQVRVQNQARLRDG